MKVGEVYIQRNRSNCLPKFEMKTSVSFLRISTHDKIWIMHVNPSEKWFFFPFVFRIILVIAVVCFFWYYVYIYINYKNYVLSLFRTHIHPTNQGKAHRYFTKSTYQYWFVLIARTAYKVVHYELMEQWLIYCPSSGPSQKW